MKLLDVQYNKSKTVKNTVQNKCRDKFQCCFTVFFYYILYWFIYRNKYLDGTQAKPTVKSQICFVTYYVCQKYQLV